MAVSYGHAAQLSFSNILQLGDHFIATDKIYGGTNTQLGRQSNSLVGRSRSAASKTLRVDTPCAFGHEAPDASLVCAVRDVLAPLLCRSCSLRHVCLFSVPRHCGPLAAFFSVQYRVAVAIALRD